MLDNPFASITIILGAAFAVALIMIVIVVDENEGENSATGMLMELNQTRLVALDDNLSAFKASAAMQHQTLETELSNYTTVIVDTDIRILNKLPTISNVMATQVLDIALMTATTIICREHVAAGGGNEEAQETACP